jgi:hypothetical protein
MAELNRLALLGWGDLANRAPCAGWRTCGRRYAVVEYESAGADRGTERSRALVVEMRESGLTWHQVSEDWSVTF